jgi:hypothetical protein
MCCVTDIASVYLYVQLAECGIQTQEISLEFSPF